MENQTFVVKKLQVVELTYVVTTTSERNALLDVLEGREEPIGSKPIAYDLRRGPSIDEELAIKVNEEGIPSEELDPLVSVTAVNPDMPADWDPFDVTRWLSDIEEHSVKLAKELGSDYNDWRFKQIAETDAKNRELCKKGEERTAGEIYRIWTIFNTEPYRP